MIFGAGGGARGPEAAGARQPIRLALAHPRLQQASRAALRPVRPVRAHPPHPPASSAARAPVPAISRPSALSDGFLRRRLRKVTAGLPKDTAGRSAAYTSADGEQLVLNELGATADTRRRLARALDLDAAALEGAALPLLPPHLPPAASAADGLDPQPSLTMPNPRCTLATRWCSSARESRLSAASTRRLQGARRSATRPSPRRSAGSRRPTCGSGSRGITFRSRRCVPAPAKGADAPYTCNTPRGARRGAAGLRSRAQRPG